MRYQIIKHPRSISASVVNGFNTHAEAVEYLAGRKIAPQPDERGSIYTIRDTGELPE